MTLAVWASPLVLLGTAEQIVERIHENSETWGIDSYVVRRSSLEDIGQVIAKLDQYAQVHGPSTFAPTQSVVPHRSPRLGLVYDSCVIARRLRGTETDALRATLELMQREFSYMDAVIDPPSSIHRLTMVELAAGPGEVWVIGSPPVAGVVMTPKPDVLYVGKLAVASSERGKGLARLLLDQAEGRAKELGVSWVELETRIELKANHAAFRALGFVETDQTAHAGYAQPTSITFRRAVQ